VLLTIVVVLVLAVIAATVWAVGFRNGDKPKGKGGTNPSNSASSSAGSTVLTPVADNTFNIYGNDSEDASKAPNAIDGSPKTAWATDFYSGGPNMGGLKPGTGLLLDMGKEVRLSQVEILFASNGSTTAGIYLGNSAAPSKTALSNFTKVSPLVSVSGDHVFNTSSAATGRYVLIWLTSLPPMQGSGSANQFQGLIYNVIVRGDDPTGT
jgi:hypothetical protein